MKRLQRLGAVRGVMHEAERRQATRLAEDQRRMKAAEQRLQELQRYREDYAHQLASRCAAGISALALRDYQIFIARLDDAIRQQQQIICRLGAELEFERGRWQEAAVRLKSVSTVIERWESQERTFAERAVQSESDERALQKAAQTSRANTDEAKSGMEHDV